MTLDSFQQPYNGEWLMQSRLWFPVREYIARGPLHLVTIWLRPALRRNADR